MTLVVSEAILVIASIVLATAISGVVMSQLGIFQGAFTASVQNQKDIALTMIKTIYATNSSSTKINVWVKNIGVNDITNPTLVDVYFGKIGSLQNIPYSTVGPTPNWNYTSPLTSWQAKNTVQINIFYGGILQKNTTYMVRIATPNGVNDDYIFST